MIFGGGISGSNTSFSLIGSSAPDIALVSFQTAGIDIIDLATDKIDWRRHYSDGYADSQAITPDGKTLYLPLRDGDSWWVLDAATGDPKAKIPVTHGKMYAADDHPIVASGRTIPG